MHKHSSIALEERARQQAVLSLRTYAADHLEYEMSELQGTLMLDYILRDIAPAIYNQATVDARAYVEERAADLEAALHKAEFPVSARRGR